MMIIVCAIAYIALAAACMYAATKIATCEDTPYVDEEFFVPIALFWPIAFPLYYAYMMGSMKKKDE